MANEQKCKAVEAFEWTCKNGRCAKEESGSWVGCEYIYMYIFIASAWVLGGVQGGGVACINICFVSFVACINIYSVFVSARAREHGDRPWLPFPEAEAVKLRGFSKLAPGLAQLRAAEGGKAAERKSRGGEWGWPAVSVHGCCWKTFYFAYCGLVGNPHLTAEI